MRSIDLHSLGLFMAAGLALNLTPGPGMLYVAARGVAEGRSAGIASALGIAVGCLVHITLVAGGLAALLAAVPLAYHIVRLIGAAYLIYLGVRVLFRPSGLSERTLAPASTWAIFSQGVVPNVLNPKVAFFFLAFIPQFVDPNRGSPALQVLTLGVLFNLSGTIVNLTVALGASRVSNRVREHPQAGKILSVLLEYYLLALGCGSRWMDDASLCARYHELSSHPVRTLYIGASMQEELPIHLFSYGTLQQESVQLALFGRLLHGLEDAMLGYRRSMIEITDPDVIAKSGTNLHPIIAESIDPTDEVPGMVFKIAHTELVAADKYEVSNYSRIEVRLKSGIDAWVYIARTNQ